MAGVQGLEFGLGGTRAGVVADEQDVLGGTVRVGRVGGDRQAVRHLGLELLERGPGDAAAEQHDQRHQGAQRPYADPGAVRHGRGSGGGWGGVGHPGHARAHRAGRRGGAFEALPVCQAFLMTAGSSGIDAVILVGGLGTRLRPLTLSAPKPMLPTAGVPFLTHLITRIRDAGIAHVVLGTSFQAEVFEQHFGDGADLGVDLEYVVETTALGTGGGIRNVADALRGDTVLVFNGDNLIGVDLQALLATHRDAGADVTLCLHRVPDPRAFGCVPTDADGRVLAFLEKTPEPVTDQINAGLYVFRRSVIDSIPAGRPVSVEKETFPDLLASGALVVSHMNDGYWRDFGTPVDFVAGSADLVRGIAPSPAVATPGEALVLPGAAVDAGAAVVGGSTVGRNCIVEAGAVLDGSVLFDGGHIAAGATVRRSVVGAGAVIGAGTVVEDAIVGDRARVGAGIELRFGARVWPDSVLADGAIRFSSDL